MATAVDVQVVLADGRDLRAVSSEVRRALAHGPVVLQGVEHLHGLLAGCDQGNVIIEGNAGDYLGVLNAGASIRVRGNAGSYLADNMTAGSVQVEGHAGYGVGAYCYGGIVVVHGNAGDFTAVMNKGADIIVGGDVGDEVATYMLAGDLVILGDAGRNLGNYLIRGTIYVGGRWRSLGHNTREEELTTGDVQRLQEHLARAGLQGDPAGFKKIVRLSERPFYKSR